MAEIQLYQGAPVIQAADGTTREIPVEVLQDFAPIVAAYQQGQVPIQKWQQACEFVVKRSQELEFAKEMAAQAGAIAQQSISSHQAVNVELAATIRAMAESRQQQPTEAILVYENPNLAAVLWTGIVAVLIILGGLVLHAVVTSPKPHHAPVPVQQNFI